MRSYDAIVIGGSMGALGVLRDIFSSLGSDFPCPIIVVQHIERTAKFDYPMVFCKTSGLIALEAEDKLPVEAGHIFFAPPGYHLYIEDDRSFALSLDALVNWSRPSIDLTFDSAARVYASRLIAVILTGANADGAEGLMRVKRAGGTTIVQNPAKAIADVMPRAALPYADHVLEDSEIGPFLRRLVSQNRKEGLS